MSNELIIGGVIGAIISVPLSIFANLATPRVQAWLEQRILSSQGKKLKRLESEYERVKRLHTNPISLFADVCILVFAFFAFLLGLVGAAVLVALAIFAGNSFLTALSVAFLTIMYGVSTVLMMIRISMVYGDVIRVGRYEKYEADILAEIRRVQDKAKSQAGSVLEKRETTERPRIDMSRYYHIVSKLSNGKCLDVPGGQIADKTPIELCSLHKGDNQQWRLVPTETEYFCIVSKLSQASPKCLDVPGGQIADKTPIELYSLHKGDNQQWKLVPTESGYFYIVSKLSQASPKCLDVPSGQMTDKTPIALFSLHNGENQQWELIAASEIDS